MALHIKGEDVYTKSRTKTADKGSGTAVTKRVYGNNVSVETAIRTPGYHTTPHFHEGEQINYVLEGEIWFFVEDQGFLCKKGDFSRIPANKIHWAWNRSDQVSVVIEAHAAPQIGGSAGEGAVPLYDTDEKPDIPAISTNQRSDASRAFDWQATERRYNLT